jgi:hypothetical protein
MQHQAVASSPAPLGAPGRGDASVPVGVLLLGVRVTAYVVVNLAEHRRRRLAGLGAVVDPALLDRLLDLPHDVCVPDPVTWAEMAGQPPAIAERYEDGAAITRRLASPLAITGVVVDAGAGRALRAVQEVSLFAGYTRRWVRIAGNRLADRTMLEAKLCGVGLLDPCGEVLMPAENPADRTVDGWSWLLEETTYRRWLSARSRNDEKESRGPATGAASVTVTKAG